MISAEGLTINITDNIITDEVEAQTRVRPIKCIISKSTSNTDIKTTWLVSCIKEITKPFRLFAHSMNSKPSRRDPKIIQCESCLRFHGKGYRCDKKTCPNCARPMHEGPCEKPILKCVNCSGPHAATFAKCPARPKIANGVVRKPTSEQLRIIRTAGEKARLHALNEIRNNAADKTATAVEMAEGITAENREQGEGNSTNQMEVDTPELTNKSQENDTGADTIVVRQ